MPENNALRSNLVTFGVLVIALAAVFFVGRSLGEDDSPDAAAAAAPARSTNETFGVVTGGEATVSGTPDVLTFTASIRNHGTTGADAMEKTNHDVRAISIAARKQGVTKSDIKTQNLSIQPNYDYRNLVDGEPRIVGYTASESVTIRVRKLSAAGKAISAVTTRGGNAVSVSNLRLSMSNRDALVAQARASAVRKSKAAAEALAEAAGRKVGDLEYVEEVAPQRAYYRDAVNFAFKRGLMSADAVTSVPIRPGKQQVSVTVNVRWALAD